MFVSLKYGGLAGGAVLMATAVWLVNRPAEILPAPQVVVVPAGPYIYRPAGEYRSGNRVVDAPVQNRVAGQPLVIMKYHVSQKDYARCVSDNRCQSSLNAGSADFAQVNVSYLDATAYGAWLSARTGQLWRLPTDAEWVRAAGERFHETILGPISNDPDPSKRWIAKYKAEAARRGKSDPNLRPIGYFGANGLGVVDINGNIWEWTVTCFKNGTVSQDAARLISDTNYCGVRAAQGKHRAFIVDFVRDAKSGGCAVGIPPDNLGIRLVRDISAD